MRLDARISFPKLFERNSLQALAKEQLAPRGVLRKFLADFVLVGLE